MKGLKPVLFFLLLGVVSFTTPVGAVDDYFFETILNKTITATTAAKTVNLAGYKEFAIMGRFEGQAGSKFRLELEFNELNVMREEIEIDTDGLAKLTKVYPVYAPRLTVTIVNPPPNLKTKLIIYAAH